jgi:ATP-binding cassette, subfamily B, bacterial CvaB/MchF/RaxB
MPLNFSFFQRRHIETIRQTEITECGLACLAMILNYYGYHENLGHLRRRFPPSLKGQSLKDIIHYSAQFGLTSRPVKCPLESMDALKLPAIIHWDLNHFVVLESIKNRHYIIHDPARGEQKITEATLSEHYTGVALELSPTNEFTPKKASPTLRLKDLWQKNADTYSSFAQILMLTLVTQIAVLVSPFFLQTAIDNVIPAQNTSLLAVLAIGFSGVAIINATALLLRNFAILRFGSTLSYQIATNLLAHLLKLPIVFFQRRHVGDVMSRFNSIEPIQTALTSGLSSIFIDGALSLLILAIMFFYSPFLVFVTMVGGLFLVLVRVVLYKVQRRRDEDVILEHAEKESFVIETLRGMVTIRLFGHEQERALRWQNKEVRYTNAVIKSQGMYRFQDFINQLVLGLEAVISIYFAVKLSLNGGFSVGMLFAFLSYKGQFLTRLSTFIEEVFKFKMLLLHLDRISDIALTDEEKGFKNTRLNHQRVSISGQLELKNIRFRYDSKDAYVLNDISLFVHPGEHICISGPSGAGKSTLMHAMLGFIEPESGFFLVEGMTLEDIGVQHYRQQIATVLQDDHLFTGSIIENICFFQDQQDMEWAQQCAHMAAIAEDIARFPMGYETLVGDMGAALSGGQKQRILLARALYRRPKILFMDEATSHLDIDNESKVSDAISSLGITRIVIAHRQETIARANLHYILQDGQLKLVKNISQHDV